MDTANSRKRFDDLVAEVFRLHRFKTERNVRAPAEGRRREVDLVLTWPSGNIRTSVEVKLFRTRMPSRDDIFLAHRQAETMRNALELEYALLVVNLRRSQLPPLTGDLEGANVLCIEDLIWLAGNAADTAPRVDLGTAGPASAAHDAGAADEVVSALIELDRELSSSLRDFDKPLDLDPGRIRPDLDKYRIHSVPPSAGGKSRGVHESGFGEWIAADLEKIPVGSKTEFTLPSGETGVPWRLLEIVGLRALQYVFRDQFHRWDEQGKVGGDDQRYDVLAKVMGVDVFSSMLVQDFRSRYVLFEFKNYKDELKPNIVFVTEKYLFPTALRSTAIIISPKGFSPQAFEATQGALRDAGKLILDLPVPVLCEMLRSRDAGGLTDERMEQRLDAYLQRLGR